MKDIAKLLHKAHLDFQKASGVNVNDDGRAKGSKFVEPTSATWIKQHRTWHPARFYTYHCAHDRSMFVPCATCKRNSSQAQANLRNLLKTK
jgi:hypothetical protein